MTDPSRKRIFVVERDDAVSRVFRRWLESADYLVDDAPDCASMLSLKGERRYDLVLANLGSLGSSPLDVIAQIVRDGYPLLLVTGGADQAVIAQAVSMGVRGPLQMPFSKNTLLAILPDIFGDRNIAEKVRDA